MTLILFQILPLFLIIGLGTIITKFKLANENWLKPIGDFTLYLGFPALIVSKLLETPIEKELLIDLAIINTAQLSFTILTLILGFKIFKFKNQTKATLVLCFMFGNFAFIGIPVLESINPQWVQKGAINSAIFLFWIFSAGIILIEWFSGRSTKPKDIALKLIKNPLLISVVVGLCLNVLEIPIPKTLTTTIGILGKAVTPIILLMIGIFIQLNPFPTKSEITAALTFSLTKLLVLPIIAIFIAKKMDVHLETSIISYAMPLAITPFAMASHYKLDKDLIANCIIISTILSIITIPLIAEMGL